MTESHDIPVSAGHEVTVIDRAQPGSGASGGNGSQLSDSYVQHVVELRKQLKVAMPVQ